MGTKTCPGCYEGAVGPPCVQHLSAELKDWTPTPDNINRLPEPLRRYIHDLETLCDPAGIVAENVLQRDNANMLTVVNNDLTAENARLRARLKEARRLLSHGADVLDVVAEPPNGLPACAKTAGALRAFLTEDDKGPTR